MRMKLLFPTGEHGPVELRDGITRIGSAANNDVVLVAPGIAQHHCEVELVGNVATLKIAEGGHVVVVNGRQISQPTILKAGDLVLFGKVGARVSALESAPAAAAPMLSDDDDDIGATRVRQALPKFILRGVSGITFGKNFPLYSSMTIGRHSECDISVPTDEVSRKHAKLQVMPDGIMVEDLGSANGTFINGKRLQRAEMLKAGDELRLDTIRFMLMSPGMEMPAAAKQNDLATKQNLPQPKVSETKKSSAMPLIIGAVIVIAIVAGLKVAGVF